jgi:hypothetical protein
MWKVLWNGVPIRKGLRSRAEADAIAERWQGSYARSKGLLKHGDKGDWIEVVRDHDSERDFDERADEARRGNPQKITIQYRVGDGGS